MQNQFAIKALAASVSILVLSTGCNSSNSTLSDRLGNSEQPVAAESATASKTMMSPRSPEPSAIPLTQIQANDGIVASIADLSHVPETDVIKPTVENTEKYQDLTDNPVIRVADQSTSTFSIDVDTGAYANVRRFLNTGQMPPSDAVRLEEMLNYFNYDYTAPDKTDQPFSIHTELATTPWNDKTRLLHIGLKGYEVNAAERPAANLVFLLDVSGSMNSPHKLGLLKSSLTMLSNDLTEKDRVSIVVYAGASGVVLEPTPGNDKRAISKALKQLKAGGSTNGAAGIELAYDMAEQFMTKNSINRIILATDGDFNVGISDIDKLKNVIEVKRKSGIALTTLGFGAGNFNDHLMEQLANVGNGNYAYIDTLNEARKVLSEELTATLLTIAKDVKIQIEFNPAQVSEYRLLGYVNRKLANEDFNNDKVDAGEIGAGHTVTALYEVALLGEGGERHTESRYQKSNTANNLDSEIAEVRLRYKMPEESASKLTTLQVMRDTMVEELAQTSENFRFSAAVAGFGQLLRQSKYLNDFDYNAAATMASNAKGRDRFGYRSELIQLIDLANNLDERTQARTGSSEKQGSGDDEG